MKEGTYDASNFDREGPGSTPRPVKRRLTAKEWATVRKAVCAGRPMTELAEAYGVPLKTIRSRSVNEQWPTPARESFRKKEILRTLENAPKASETPPASGDAQNTNSTSSNEDENTKFMSCIDRHVEALRVASDSDPETFEDAAGRLAQAMVAVGLATVQPPRTINELAKWEDLRRKFQKRDAPQQLGGLFDPVRPLRRYTGHVVDAATVDVVDDGFEI